MHSQERIGQEVPWSTRRRGAAVSGGPCTPRGVVAPWESGLRVTEDGGVEQSEADERLAEELAEAILTADPTPQEGDGQSPPDPDEAFTAFAARATARWATGPRHRINSPGPVRSARFA